MWSLVGLVHGLCYAAIAFMFVLLLELGMRWLSREGDAQATYRISFRHNFRGWGVLFLIIVLCWMPYVIALYPGVMWYDTSNQLLQWNHLPNLFTDGQLTDHHPIADTAIFGLFVQFGNLIGSGDLGIFLYTMIQTVVTASAMAYCLLYMRRIGASHRLCMAALAFVSLFPIFPMYSSPMVKDSLFLPIMVLFGVQCVEIVRSRGEVLRRTSVLGHVDRAGVGAFPDQEDRYVYRDTGLPATGRRYTTGTPSSSDRRGCCGRGGHDDHATESGVSVG